MSHRDPDTIDVEIREIFSRTDGGTHPSSEELAAYAKDELTENEAGHIQSHLGLCRECTAAVLALEFPRRETTPESPSDAEVATGIEAIMASVGATEESAHSPFLDPTANDERSHRSVRSQGTRRLFAAAAVLAAVCLSLALLTLRLRQQVGDLEVALAQARGAPLAAVTDPLTPLTNIPIVDLFPSSVVRGDTASTPPIPLDVDAAMVALILTPSSGLEPADGYSLRIFDSADRELWRGPARLDPAGTLVLLLPKRFAEADASRVRLYRLEDGLEEPLETFELRFEP